MLSDFISHLPPIWANLGKCFIFLMLHLLSTDWLNRKMAGEYAPPNLWECNAEVTKAFFSCGFCYCKMGLDGNPGYTLIIPRYLKEMIQQLVVLKISGRATNDCDFFWSTSTRPQTTDLQRNGASRKPTRRFYEGVIVFQNKMNVERTIFGK